MAELSTLLTKTQNMIDDVLDQDFLIQLINDAKDEVEEMVIWLQLLKEQVYTVSAGNNFETAIGSLPNKFAMDMKAVEGDSDFELEKVPFDDYSQKKFNSRGYFIDLANNNLHLSGANQSGKVIRFYYTEHTDDLDLVTNTIWVFPSRFHSILPLKAAELYYFSDSGEPGRSWDQSWAIQFERKLQRMMSWNDWLKVKNRRPTYKRRGGTPKSVGRGSY